jgi:hypothetical protein
MRRPAAAAVDDSSEIPRVRREIRGTAMVLYGNRGSLVGEVSFTGHR